MPKRRPSGSARPDAHRVRHAAATLIVAAPEMPEPAGFRPRLPRWQPLQPKARAFGIPRRP
ncbi:MAG: hypothetical protein HYZ89_04850 [Candidatus Omnitrophica bacterium]|nr:hypothetical protein [Candidatus Omnitrophota bacterium]